MYLVKTIYFIPAGETEVINIEIYVTDETNEFGYWNIDNNTVLLTSALYNEFNNLKTQVGKRKFFAKLKMVSATLLT